MEQRISKEQAFVKWIKKECKKYKVKCSLRNTSYLVVSNNIRCSGYFSDEDEKAPVLAVAMKNPQWLEILVHEYCHLTQWIDGIDLWKKADKSLVLVDEWLSGKTVCNINYHLSVARDLELDNEKRSVALIKKWDLNIDVENYIKKANAYIQFYNYLKKTRRWSKPNNQPYKNEEIVNIMSTKFNMNYKKMSKRVEKVFINENI